MDIATSGVASAMLAKRWQSPRMIDLSRTVLEGLLNDEELLRSLENIEVFRALRKHATRIVTAESSLNNARVDGRRMSDIRRETREMAKQRKKIEEALLQFLTRVPIFMYLTDYREQSLLDVIHTAEPALFTKVTGLKIRDFESLCRIGVINTQVLNQAIYAFKRLEALSLEGPAFSSDPGQSDEGAVGSCCMVDRQ